MVKGNIDRKENYRVEDIYHSLTAVLMRTIKQFVDFLRGSWLNLVWTEFEVNIMIWQLRERGGQRGGSRKIKLNVVWTEFEVNIMIWLLRGADRW